MHKTPAPRRLSQTSKQFDKIFQVWKAAAMTANPYDTAESIKAADRISLKLADLCEYASTAKWPRKYFASLSLAALAFGYIGPGSNPVEVSHWYTLGLCILEQIVYLEVDLAGRLRAA